MRRQKTLFSSLVDSDKSQAQIMMLRLGKKRKRKQKKANKKYLNYKNNYFLKCFNVA